MSAHTVLVLPAWYPTERGPFLGPFVRDHARSAAAFGHRMVVVVDEGPRSGVHGPFALTEERDGDLRVFRFSSGLRTGLFGYVPAALAIARRLAREGTPVDLLHAHVHRMGWAAVLVGRLLRRPVVITEHSSEWVRGTITPGALRRARIAFRRAALVCPVNERLQRAIEGYGVRGRFRVVPNTVDAHVFHPPTPPPASGSPRRLVNVALHVEVKGLDLLLHAFARLAGKRPELELQLIGEGPLTPELRRLAAELDLGECVHFAGFATQAQIADELRASDVFVLSSLSENLPLSVLEALCCGLPVAATDVGGIPDAVGDDGALAPAGDVAGLAAAIGTVIERSEQFDCEDIARRAAARWSFEAVGGVWDEIYRSLCTPQSPA